MKSKFLIRLCRNGVSKAAPKYEKSGAAANENALHPHRPFRDGKSETRDEHIDIGSDISEFGTERPRTSHRRKNLRITTGIARKIAPLRFGRRKSGKKPCGKFSFSADFYYLHDTKPANRMYRIPRIACNSACPAEKAYYRKMVADSSVISRTRIRPEGLFPRRPAIPDQQERDSAYFHPRPSGKSSGHKDQIDHLPFPPVPYSPFAGPEKRV